jgi:hypothetical protein
MPGFCDMWYQGDEDTDSKIRIVQHISCWDFLTAVSDKKVVQRASRLRSGSSALVYGIEIWTVRQRNKNKLRTSEMK